MYNRSYLWIAGLLFLLVACGEEVEQPPHEVLPGDTDEAFFPVVENERWGYINQQGEVVIEPRFDNAHVFSENRAVVEINGRFGFIDRSGEVIIEPRYEDAWHFSDGRAPVRYGEEWMYIDRDGNHVEDVQAGLDPHVVEIRSVPPDAYRRARVDGQYGFRDDDGDLVIQPRYDRAWHFSEGRARVHDGERWGYIDASGEFVIEPQFDRAWDFRNGLALVRTGDHFGYIDRDGHFVWEPSH